MARQIVVLIPTAGRAELLERTLDSLGTSHLPASYQETIVVENGPKGKVEEIVQAYQSTLNARYVYIEQPGKSNALNVVMQHLADDCLIYMTDDDVRFSEGALQLFSDAAEECSSGTFYGGSMDIDYEEPPPKWLVPHLPLDAKQFNQQDYDRGNPPMVFLGCNWAAFAGDLRRAGGFDTRFGPGGTSGAIGQESEMQQRLLQHDVEPQFIAKAVVWHYCPIKRCSPDYFVHRQYRYGILDAMRTGTPTNRLGIPYWHLRKLVRNALRYARSRFDDDEERRFLAKRDFYFQWGQVRGAWRAARQTGNVASTSSR